MFPLLILLLDIFIFWNGSKPPPPLLKIHPDHKWHTIFEPRGVDCYSGSDPHFFCLFPPISPKKRIEFLLGPGFWGSGVDFYLGMEQAKGVDLY